MKAIVHVGLKPGVLDPQGKAVADSLGRMGFDEVAGARIGDAAVGGEVVDLVGPAEGGDGGARCVANEDGASAFGAVAG